MLEILTLGLTSKPPILEITTLGLTSKKMSTTTKKPRFEVNNTGPC